MLSTLFTSSFACSHTFLLPLIHILDRPARPGLNAVLYRNRMWTSTQQGCLHHCHRRHQNPRAAQFTTGTSQTNRLVGWLPSLGEDPVSISITRATTRWWRQCVTETPFIIITIIFVVGVVIAANVIRLILWLNKFVRLHYLATGNAAPKTVLYSASLARTY